MSKSKISVTCLFTDEGEAAAQIVFHSFEFFLQRELSRDSDKFALSGPVQL